MQRPEWLTWAAWALIAANLLPLAGVMFLGWGVFQVLMLYWTENVVIGVYNVLRMITVRPEAAPLWLGKLFLIPFFVVHYGMFTAGHGFFLMAFFQDEVGDLPGPSASLMQTFFDALATVVDHPGAFWAVGCLLLSHGLSFVTNYIRSGEYQRVTLQQLMHQPYTRVVVMHLTIIGMGFLVALTGTRTAGLVLMVALKIGVDLRAHVAEHRRIAALAPRSGSA
jgi:hypothetical protein